MRVLLVICLFACIAFTQSASYYIRNGRELLIPIENEVIREEIVSELRKEAEVAVEESEPMPVVDAIVREEVIVPVETLRIAEPVVEVQEPIAISDKEVVVPIVNALRNAASEIVGVPEAAFVPASPAQEPLVAAVANEIVPETRAQAVEETVVPAAEVAPVVAAAVESDTPIVEKENIAVKAIAAEAEPVVPVEMAADMKSEVKAEVKAEDAAELAERQSEGDTPVRPSLIQAAQNTLTNLITNNPIANAIQAIRPQAQADEESAPVPLAAEGAAAPAPAPAVTPATPTHAPSHRPTIFESLQHTAQNFQHQLQNAIQGGAPASAGGENRPGFIQNLQHTIGQAFNRPIGLFRPPNDPETTEQKEGAAPVAVEPVVEPVQVVKEKMEIVDDKVDAAAPAIKTTDVE